jgi:hypothetical protein
MSAEQVLDKGRRGHRGGRSEGGRGGSESHSSSSDLLIQSLEVVSASVMASASSSRTGGGGRSVAEAANSLSSILGPRASKEESFGSRQSCTTKISVTSNDDVDHVPVPGSGIAGLCMIVDRFETDVRRVSRGSMLLPGEEQENNAKDHRLALQRRKASHQPQPRSLPPPQQSRQRSHNDLMLLSPAKSSVTNFVESVRKSSFSSKMAEILDGDFNAGGGHSSRAVSGFSVSCAAAAAVSEAAATVVVKCSGSDDDEENGGGKEVSWRGFTAYGFDMVNSATMSEFDVWLYV